MFNPATADAWKRQVAVASMRHLPPSPLRGPVGFRAVFYFPRPRRLCKKADPPGVVWHDVKPDADNAAKAVMDALSLGPLTKRAREALREAGWWRDDCQVASLDVRKLYAAKGHAPGAAVHVWSLQ